MSSKKKKKKIPIVVYHRAMKFLLFIHKDSFGFLLEKEPSARYLALALLMLFIL